MCERLEKIKFSTPVTGWSKYSCTVITGTPCRCLSPPNGWRSLSVVGRVFHRLWTGIADTYRSPVTVEPSSRRNPPTLLLVSSCSTCVTLAPSSKRAPRSSKYDLSGPKSLLSGGPHRKATREASVSLPKWLRTVSSSLAETSLLGLKFRARAIVSKKSLSDCLLKPWRRCHCSYESRS